MVVRSGKMLDVWKAIPRERELMWKIVHFRELWKQLRDCVSGELSYSL